MRERFSYNIKRMCFYMDEEGNGRKLYNFTTGLCLYKLFARFLWVIICSIMDRLQQFLCIEGILRLNPKFCVNSQRGENRSEFIVRGSGFIRLPPCAQYNAGGDGCQGRRQGRRSSERCAAARRPLTSGPGGVIRACVRQSRWTAARGSRSSPAAVPSTFS